MRTAIFTIDTESYEAKKKSAAGEALKRMLEQKQAGSESCESFAKR